MKKLLLFLGLSLIMACASAPLPNIHVQPTPVDVNVSIEDIEDVANFQRTGVKGGVPEISVLSWIDRLDPKVGYTKIFSGIAVSDLTRCWNDWTIFESLGIDYVIIMINSPGGAAFQGLALADLIHNFRAKGFEFEMQGSGIIASAAVPVFVAGDHREALSSTIFMLHEAALWKWPGRETASDIKSQNTMMERLTDQYTELMEKGTGTPSSKFYDLMLNTTWMSCEEAKALNMVDACL
jgi:ATP-dependent protease ClpP protease subunit